MNRFFLLVLGVLLAAGCGSEEAELAPAGVLPHDSMVAIIVDIQLIEGAYQKRVIKSDNAREKALNGYVQTFQKHGITQARFDSSYSWYLDKPERMHKVMQDVGNSLSMLQAKESVRKDEED